MEDGGFEVSCYAVPPKPLKVSRDLLCWLLNTVTENLKAFDALDSHVFLTAGSHLAFSWTESPPGLTQITSF
jgi:hypothetical protein